MRDKRISLCDPCSFYCVFLSWVFPPNYIYICLYLGLCIFQIFWTICGGAQGLNNLCLVFPAGAVFCVFLALFCLLLKEFFLRGLDQFLVLAKICCEPGRRKLNIGSFSAMLTLSLSSFLLSWWFYYFFAKFCLWLHCVKWSLLIGSGYHIGYQGLNRSAMCRASKPPPRTVLSPVQWSQIYSNTSLSRIWVALIGSFFPFLVLNHTWWFLRSFVFHPCLVLCTQTWGSYI